MFVMDPDSLELKYVSTAPNKVRKLLHQTLLHAENKHQTCPVHEFTDILLFSCFFSRLFVCLAVFRQQYAQALAQQKAAALSSAPVQQQQQHQQQINLLLQQYQALKLRLLSPLSMASALR